MTGTLQACVILGTSYILYISYSSSILVLRIKLDNIIQVLYIGTPCIIPVSLLYIMFISYLIVRHDAIVESRICFYSNDKLSIWEIMKTV